MAQKKGQVWGPSLKNHQRRRCWKLQTVSCCSAL